MNEMAVGEPRWIKQKAVQGSVACNSSVDKQWGKVFCNLKLCLPSFPKDIKDHSVLNLPLPLMGHMSLPVLFDYPCSQG